MKSEKIKIKLKKSDSKSCWAIAKHPYDLLDPLAITSEWRR